VVLTIIAGLLFWFLSAKRSRQRSSENDRLGFNVADDHSGTPPSSSGPPLMGEAGIYNLSPFPEEGSSHPSLGVGVGSPGTFTGVPSTVSGRIEIESQHGRKASQTTFESSDLSTLVSSTSPRRSRGESVPSPSAMRTSFVQHEDAGPLNRQAPTPGVNQEAVELPPASSPSLAVHSQDH
jgi:hypothetical protein